MLNLKNWIRKKKIECVAAYKRRVPVHIFETKIEHVQSVIFGVVNKFRCPDFRIEKLNMFGLYFLAFFKQFSKPS